MSGNAEILGTDFEPGRFQRLSSQPAIQNPYSFSDFQKGRENQGFSPNELQNSEDVILAYYGIDARALIANTFYIGTC
jgi:hypothetical protein